MIYRGKPCLPYFSSVVKNVANPNIEIKKLVYIYLLYYAESDPDLALLSVNAIQKSLTDQNPQVRAMALKTMSGMQVPVISQIVSLAIKRGVGDMSPHVRKAAALAIPKCYRLDPNTLPQLLDYLSTLLGDKQYYVVSPAVMAFLEVCPDRIDLIHQHYRSLVKKLVDMDEWGQLATLRLLLHYSRRCFPRKMEKLTKTTKKGFYEDDPSETIETEEQVPILDPDLELFLRACKPLLQSRNSAVIVSVTSCFLYLGTPSHLESAIGPMVSLLRGPPAIQQNALSNIVLLALSHSSLFVPYASHFFIRNSDPPDVWQLKIELLTLIFPHCAIHLKSVILSELEHFAHDHTSVELIRESVRAIGRCAQSDPTMSARCFHILLNQISSFDNVLVSEVLTVIRHLIQQNPGSHKKTIVRLARHLDKTVSAEARATIIWLVAEYAVGDPEIDIAPDVLRILVKGFADESEQAKQQILLLAAKVYLQYLQANPQPASSQANGGSHHSNPDEDRNQQTSSPPPVPESENNVAMEPNHPVPVLWRYILLLTRYDTSYDLRDRARLFKALFANPVDATQLASLVLLAPKPVPFTPSPSENRRGLRLGSTSLVLGRADSTGTGGGLGLPGYEEIPPWVKEGEEPDPRLRDVETAAGMDTPGSGEKGKVSASARLDEAIKERGLQGVVEGSGVKEKGKSVSTKARTLDEWLDESESQSEETDDEEEGSSSGGGEEEEMDEDEEESTDEDEIEEKRTLVRKPA